MSGVPAPYVYNATVKRVEDGDTIVVDVNWGWWRYDIETPVRLLGINAAEHGTPGGDAATANLTALLPPGTPVVLHTAKPDKYQRRWDAIVETPTIPDLGAYLVSQQWAAPYNGDGVKPVPPWPRTVR